ncbi:hypothetical protein RvY_04902 [Ramazzottius varieornatus]|uniref:Uncharacterized protein n=1 Tax=Ramazzottius varieornatus TaxID=947166 RepID=A0A1D1V335_RAMVA|nr:hypothetical protein RvY_04902 [Ramazzottius varieornatus]
MGNACDGQHLVQAVQQSTWHTSHGSFGGGVLEVKREAKLRLDIWAEFDRKKEKIEKTRHHQATCKHCKKANVLRLEIIRGEKYCLQNHLTKCKHVLKEVKSKYAARPEKKAEPDPRGKKQSSMFGFLDRSLTKVEKQQFEILLADTWADSNFSLQSIENESLVKLFQFLRLTVEMHSRRVLTDRILKSRINDAVSQVTQAISHKKDVTLTFDGFKNVSQNKLLGNVTNRVEDISGLNYNGEYVVVEVAAVIQTMEHKYGSTFRAVTCDSDGAHIKARRLLSAKSGQSSGDEGELELIDLTGEALKKQAAKKVKASTSLQLRGLTVAEVQRGIKDESLATKENASGRSAVWEDFLRVVTVDTDEVLEFVARKNCTQVYTFSIKTGTTSLLHHSAKCKEKAARSIQQYLKVGVTTEETSEALAKFCALNSRAFRVCEGKGFELMIDTVLGIARKHKGAPFPARELLPSAATVSTSVTNQAKALRTISVPKLKKILTTRGVYISLDG